MKKILIALLFLPATLVSQVEFQNITFYEAQKQAREKGKIIFVNVYRSQPEVHATRDREAMEQVLSDKELVAYLKENFILLGIDMSQPEVNSYFREHLHGRMFPCIVFYTEYGVPLQGSNWHRLLAGDNPSSQLRILAERSIADAAKQRANTRAIEFQDISFEEALVMAREKNKMIFISAYTEWCRPCRLMAMQVYTVDKVADFFNQNFICLRVDFTRGNNSEIATKYGIRAFPSYLFINGNGDLIHKDTGFKYPEPFIAVGQAALDLFGNIFRQESVLRPQN